jgi:hypothetical protein
MSYHGFIALMSTASIVTPARTAASPWRLSLTALLLLGGWLHCVAAQIAWTWHTDTDTDLTQMLGISPMELMIAGIAGFALYRGARTERLGLPALGFVLLLLVPSSLASHATLTLFALWVASGTKGQARTGALLFAGLGLCGLWSVLDEQLTGDWPLRADAVITKMLLQPWIPGIERLGNVVGVPNGHRIVILVGCSTAYGLPLVLLGLTALSLRDGRLPRHFGYAAAGMVALYVVINELRLAMLGISGDLYHLGHGPYGEMVFDGLIITMPLVIAARLNRTDEPDRPEPPAIRAAPPGRLWATALMALMVVGLGIKGARIAQTPMESKEVQTRNALLGFLSGRGWLPTGQQGLTMDGASTVQYFSRPGCPGTLAVGLAPRAPEAASMLRLALGADMRWLEAGVLYDQPPLARQALRSTLSAAIARLGGPRDRVMPILGIAPPPGETGSCAPPSAAAWSELDSLP